MRPGQNKRMRGRPNNNNGGGHRKGPNPLTRSYESNGPDVKVRGNAHHVAEKYLQLARDAQSSGDPVSAESYLQHAEHYFRLIASAQAAQAGYARQPDAVDTEVDEDDDSGLPDRFASPQPAVPFVPQQQAVPQAYGERQPYNGGSGGEQRQPYNGGSGGERQPYGERPANGERPQFGGYNRSDRNGQERNNQQRRPYEDRQGERGDRPFGDRQSRRERYAQERNGYDRPFERQNREGGERPRDVETPRDLDSAEQPRVETAEAVEAPRSEAPRSEAPAAFEAVPQAEAAPRRRERAAPAPASDEGAGLPSFITTPTRVQPAAEAPAPAAEPSLAATPFPGDDAEAAPKYPRRRRRTVRAAEDAPAEAPPSTSDD